MEHECVIDKLRSNDQTVGTFASQREAAAALQTDRKKRLTLAPTIGGRTPFLMGWRICQASHCRRARSVAWVERYRPVILPERDKGICSVPNPKSPKSPARSRRSVSNSRLQKD